MDRFKKQPTLSEEQMNEFREAFDLYDKDHSGQISTRELGLLMRSLGQNPTQQELMDMINEFDIDDNEQMDFGEFVQLMTKKLYEIDDMDEQVSEAARVFDTDDLGYISVDEMRMALQHCVSGSEKLSAQQIEELVTTLDKDGDKQIKYAAFGEIISANGSGFF